MAQVSLTQGLAALKSSDFSYASKYETEITFQGVTNKDRNLTIRCDNITMPGRNLRTVMNGNVYGPPHEMVQGQTFAEVAATFYMGSDMAERYFFEEWQKVTYNPDTYDINYYKEYVGAVEIYALNEKDERTMGIRLEEAFPKTIDAVPFSHASSNAINKVGVSFAYRYWRNIATEPQKANLESTLQDILKNAVIRQVQSQIPAVLRRLF